MRQYKFDKPLVESTFPPQDVNTYWVDVDESTRKLLTIKEFSQADGEWKTTMRMPDSYLVNITIEGDGATIACDKPWYKAGDTVTLTATVEEEYEIKELTASWAGGYITLTEEDENVWSFEMPAGDVQAVGSTKLVSKITLLTKTSNPTLGKISCTGEIKVSSIYNGEKLVETYTDLTNHELSIQADANTEIVISGDQITSCQTAVSGAPNTSWVKISVKNTTLTSFYTANCYNMTDLIIENNTSLTTLTCNLGQKLANLVLNNNTSLTSLNCANIKKIVSISYPATNSDVSTAIAGAITNATSTTGTVYTDSTAAYYSTIATAATNKGWTIAPIPE